MSLDDPALEGVSAVLFDEFHERSLDADLGLALALDSQAGLREDLRLQVLLPTTATPSLTRLNTELARDFLATTPTIAAPFVIARSVTAVTSLLLVKKSTDLP